MAGRDVGLVYGASHYLVYFNWEEVWNAKVRLSVYSVEVHRLSYQHHKLFENLSMFGNKCLETADWLRVLAHCLG